ncbi:hypothetical protein V8E51_003255 [Hyaloscypha variabilis]
MFYGFYALVACLSLWVCSIHPSICRYCISVYCVFNWHDGHVVIPLHCCNFAVRSYDERIFLCSGPGVSSTYAYLPYADC